MLTRLIVPASFALLTALPADAQDWPQWRGPLGTGEAPDADPPLTWSADENIRWKVPIPGRGHGSPIVFGDLVFVLTAEPFGAEVGGGADIAADDWRRPVAPTRKQRFMVFALRRATGEVAWSDVAIEALPHETTHGDGTWASSSALTDGERLYAFFGSRGLFAYDLSGERLWEVQLGNIETRKGFGEGSSPAVFGDTLVVQRDQEGPSYLVAFDVATGEERWRTERDDVTTWSTPLVTEVDGRAQVITGGTPYVRGYDLATGKELWRCEGLGGNQIPNPVLFGDAVIAMSGYRDPGAVAVRLTGAAGDVSGSDAVLWTVERHTSYVPSPLLADGLLFFIKSNAGMLSCVDAESGGALYSAERLPTVANVYASPVASRDHVYVVGRDGATDVLARGPDYEVLASNTLDDSFDASPALAGNELYLRGAQHLYCIAADVERD